MLLLCLQAQKDQGRGEEALLPAAPPHPPLLPAPPPSREKGPPLLLPGAGPGGGQGQGGQDGGGRGPPKDPLYRDLLPVLLLFHCVPLQQSGAAGREE